MAQIDQTPATMPVKVVTGDTLTEFTVTVQADSVDVTLSASVAQVRAKPATTSDVLATLTTSESGGDVTVGGDTITLAPGTYHWDLQTTSTELGVFTVVGGPFVVLAGVSTS